MTARQKGTPMEITIRTREVDGVSVVSTVHLTAFHLGSETIAKATSDQQAALILGTVSGLLGFNPEGRHDAHLQAAHIADDLVNRWIRIRPELLSETVDWLRALADFTEARTGKFHEEHPEVER